MRNKEILISPDNNAIHYTNIELSCCECGLKRKGVYEIKGKGRYCPSCFLSVLPYIDWKSNYVGTDDNGEYICIRYIIDPLCTKRLEHKKQERNKMTLKLRYSILKRDSFKCKSCGRPSHEIGLEVDHIIPISKGGISEPNNLQVLCFLCNRGKSTS